MFVFSILLKKFLSIFDNKNFSQDLLYFSEKSKSFFEEKFGEEVFFAIFLYVVLLHHETTFSVSDDLRSPVNHYKGQRPFSNCSDGTQKNSIDFSIAINLDN